MLGKNSPHLSQFLEASCIPWLVASSSSKTDTADPDLLVLLHPDSASFILSLPLSGTSWVASEACCREGSEVPPCPSLQCKIPVPPLPGGKGGLGWHSMPGTVPSFAASGGHSRTGSGPYIGSHSLSAAQWTSHLAFSVSLKATSPRTCLDTQNTYILKALMYSTTLSSRSESRSVRPTLCNPKDYTVHGILQVRILEPFPSPGDRPNPGIEPRSPTLHADSLPAEPQGKSYSHQHEDWYV